MDQFEKVCQGLEHCKTEDCSGCPYEDTSAPVGKFGTDELVACRPVLFADALSLIRQQPKRAAHVMTLKEIENMTPDPDTGDNFCWIEYRDGATRLIHVNLVDSLCPVAEYPNGHKSLVYQCSGSSGHANYLHDQVYYIRTWYVHHGDFDTYNLTWRCWTQRPTDEQRKAVPWE